MDAHTVTVILITLASALILALATIVWFAVTRWIQHVDSLQVSIEGLRAAINAWESKFVTVTQHKADLRQLRTETALGRRQMDHCLAADCPYEKTGPVPLPDEEP